MLLTLLVVWASASVPLAVGQDPGPPVPPCEAPEWVTKKSWSDESFHVVRAIEASEDNATALERALLVAVRELLTSPAGLTRDLTDVLADLGMAGPPGADPVAAFEVAPTADEKKVIECVCGENKILQQHWYDSCNRKMWVHVWGTFDAVKAAAADLVTFSDLDLALEKTLQFLAGQVSPDKHRLIVYTVVQKKVAGKTGEYLRTRVETVAAGKRFFTVVQVNALEDGLVDVGLDVRNGGRADSLRP